MCICKDPSCDGFCNIGIGKRLYDFQSYFKENSLIKSVEVGKTEKDYKGVWLTVKGYEYSSEKEGGFISPVSRILVPSGNATPLKLNSIFKLNNMQIVNSLNEFGKAFKIDSTELETVKNDLMGLNKLNKVLLPFKFDTPMKVKMHLGDKDFIEKGDINTIKWVINKAGELECSVSVRISKERCSKHKLVEAYGTEFEDLSVEVVNSKKGVISYSKAGYVKPVVFKRGNNMLAVDCSSVYIGDSARGKVKEIGVWKGGNKSVIGLEGLKLMNSTGLKEVWELNRDKLALVRMKMAPLKVGESLIVEV